MNTNTPKVLDCGHPVSKHCESTTGYGSYKLDNGSEIKICWNCCAMLDRAQMLKDGKATLYLCSTDPSPLIANGRAQGRGALSHYEGGWKVTNWPGDLKFNVTLKTISRHNIAGRRYDVWFIGPDGYEWHGITYGDNTQICHCRRTKKRIRKA